VGAYLEFWHGRIEAADVDVALALPGGGCWEVGRGQFTDDTELALCLAHGLAGHHPSAGFPADSVALQYAW
jgi:ADP-ribosylglycohydrolase